MVTHEPPKSGRLCTLHTQLHLGPHFPGARPAHVASRRPAKRTKRHCPRPTSSIWHLGHCNRICRGHQHQPERHVCRTRLPSRVTLNPRGPLRSSWLPWHCASCAPRPRDPLLSHQPREYPTPHPSALGALSLRCNGREGEAEAEATRHPRRCDHCSAPTGPAGGLTLQVLRAALPAAVHELQEPAVLCPDALPGRVAHRTEVAQVPAKEAELTPRPCGRVRTPGSGQTPYGNRTFRPSGRRSAVPVPDVQF